MTYYLLQASAMFLVAYFVGCWFGCLAKTIFAEGPIEAEADETMVRRGGRARLDDRAMPVPAQVTRDRPAAVSPTPAAVAVSTRAPGPAPETAVTTAQRAPQPSGSATTPSTAQPPMTRPLATPVATPIASQPSGAARAPGSGVSAEVTAAAAAAAAATVAAAARPTIAPSSAPASMGPVDDLKRIKGIGPEIERKLNSAGVTRFAQIGAWTTRDVARINAVLGEDRRVQHENWIEQAQILANGNQTVFSRRVDRGEVNTGMVDSWTPTAPSSVVTQAQAAAPVTTPIVAQPTAPRQASDAAAAAAAAATAAIAAASAIGTTASPAVAPAVPATPPVTSGRTVTAPPPAPPQASPPPAVPPVAQPISMRPAISSGNLRRFVRLAAPEGKPDDLSLIDGIGEKTAADLNRYGIYHYWQLAAMGPDDIDYMESRIGHKGNLRREEWPEQARELMAGKPPRAKTDRERASHGQQAPHEHPSHVHRPLEQPVSQPATPPVPAQVQAPTQAPAQRPVAVTVAAPPVIQATPGIAIAAAGAAAAAAVAAATGQRQAVTPPPPAAPSALPVSTATAPAPAPVKSAAPPLVETPPAANETPTSTWTPRSRPGNQAASGQRDDLKRIKGVGVVIEKKLEAMGITTFAQIANWTTADIDKVSNALDFKGRIEREGWIAQARILDGGGQTDFSRRMDRGDLSGGRA